MISKRIIEDLVQERIAELSNGLFVVDITVSSSNVIHVELDKEEGGVSVDDCIRVSRNVEHNLDREVEDFELHVSSAGLDKPFRNLKQFQKNVGRMVKTVSTDGRKMEGILKQADEKGIVLEMSRMEKPEGKKKKELVIEHTNLSYDQIKETKIIISFK